MRSVTFLVAVLAVAPLTRVLAQERTAVKVGDVVRVTAPDLDLHRHTGRLLAVQRGDLTVDTLTVARASITRLEVQRGRKSLAGRGAVIGFLVGGAIGLGLSAAWTADDCVFIQGPSCEEPGEKARVMFLGTTAVGLVGMGFGAAIGAFLRTDRWEEVSLDRLRVSVAPQRDGRFGLGLSVGF